MTSSFPSGHAMLSASVYLTLGALLMRLAKGRLAKFYCIAIAMLATLLVGSTRVFLGVHYPTDVLAGWLVGMVWALLCWMAEWALERRAGLKREQRQYQEEADDLRGSRRTQSAAPKAHIRPRRPSRSTDSQASRPMMADRKLHHLGAHNREVKCSESILNVRRRR